PARDHLLNTLEVIPLDIMLEIANELDLVDSVHLLSTCSTFRSLLFSRNFWIKALHRIKNVRQQALPCTDPRWSRDSISPVSVRTIIAGTDILRICVIPGSDFILTATSEERVSCLDTRSGETLASIDFPNAEAGLILGSSPFELLGQSWIPVGCAYRSGTIELSALRLDFRNRKDVTIHKHASKTWHSPDKVLHDVTIDGDMVAGDILHSIPLGSHRKSTAPFCILYQGFLYMTRHHFDGLAEIIRFGSEGSSSSPAPDSPNFYRMDVERGTLLWEYPRAASLGPCHMRVPTYSVLNVTSRGTADGDVGPEFVHFWTVDSNPSSFEVYRHPCEINEIFVGSAGTSVVLWDAEDSATLLRFMAHPTPHTTAHRLDLSGTNQRFPIFELDDRMGVLYMRGCVTSEVLYILSYV
ncbi:hypothetical protein FB451DRAFT_1239055, partial [Mycena latifolia]